MRDWMISKKRYWGLALPIWRCDCGWFDVVGGRDELRERAAAGWDEFEGHAPHRPWVDAVQIPCDRCGGRASRIPDVGNPWLDAGIVPYSTMRYFDDRDEWKRWFPADLVIESLPGQFRNWFYALLTMSTMLEGREPVKTVVGHSQVVDEQGEEMHKSTGNAIWFGEAADRMGADLVRWLSAAQPLTQQLRFGLGRAEEVQSWLRTLWNVYSFLSTYANVDRWPDGWPEEGAAMPGSEMPAETPLDRWLKLRMASAAGEVASGLESFEPPRATRALLALLDDLSNWWVRRSRRRFWRGGSGADKVAAYRVLHTVLLDFTRLLAPFMPFTAEMLYQRLAAPFAGQLPESVHLCPFPEGTGAGDDEGLLAECARARDVIRLGRAARAEAGLRVRQPLAAAFVFAADGSASSFPHFEQDILEELNVKSLRFAAARDGVGGASAAEGDLAVGLDAELTEELLLEGIARDLVRHVQNLRRRSGLQVDQRIALWIDGEGRVNDAVRRFGSYLAAETLATAVSGGAAPADAVTTECRVQGQSVALGFVPSAEA
jgi:isoleucyl-tRNA synthetase